MKKITLPVGFFITLHLTISLFMACTPRPDELPAGDSTSAELPPPAGDTARADKQKDPMRENYILPMDTTFVRDSADYTMIKVGGPLGDGCQRYEYADSVKVGTILRMTFWASRPKDPNTICTQQMQYVEREVRVPKGIYTQLLVILPKDKQMTKVLTAQ